MTIRILNLPMIAVYRIRRATILLAACTFVCASSAGLGVNLTASTRLLDRTFGAGAGVVSTAVTEADGAYSVEVQSDGKILLAGACGRNGPGGFCILRYLSNGAVDSSFAIDGSSIVQVSNYLSYATSIAVFADDSFVVGGVCQTTGDPELGNDFCFAQFDAHGQLDPTFGSNGKRVVKVGATESRIYTIRIQPDGLILAAGSCGSYRETGCLIRLKRDGALDTSFGANGVRSLANSRFDGQIAALVVEPGGKLIIAGGCYSAIFCMARLQPNGNFDATFGVDGIVRTPAAVQSAINNIVFDAGGSIVVGGFCAAALGGEANICVAKFSTFGVQDTTFGVSGIATVKFSTNNDGLIGLSIEPTGNLLLAARCGTGGGFGGCVARLTPNGQLDASFEESGMYAFPLLGINDVLTAFAMQTNRKLIVAGQCCTSPTCDQIRFCAARLVRDLLAPSTCALNADANDTLESSTDALLILRYILGYRGDALTNGVLGSNPTRTGATLETYLASLNFDADGDGQANAMTDGLLILRAMLGLSGDALTVGAVNTSSSNARTAQQILTWIESTHGVACLP